MTSPKPAGQDGLFAADAVERRRGRVEAACQAAVDSAALDPRDAGLAAAYVAAGRAVDVASTRSDPYGVAAALRELREAGRQLQLDPASRPAGAGNLESFLAALAEPS